MGYAHHSPSLLDRPRSGVSFCGRSMDAWASINVGPGHLLDILLCANSLSSQGFASTASIHVAKPIKRIAPDPNIHTYCRSSRQSQPTVIVDIHITLLMCFSSPSSKSRMQRPLRHMSDRPFTRRNKHL